MARRRSSQTGKSATAKKPEAALLHPISISGEVRRRYLNYALSVITSRAVPDVRDGLKPVQRRILYVMYNELRLTPDAKYVKCARIVGDTIGKFHPHGDTAVYDALVRLAQDFTYRGHLVDGHGNFGSIMGLPAAAARYTEARLRPLAEQLMSELRYDTVETRLNYDGTRTEPVVLPARFPNLLVNGTQGIAVGMATNIPPHNLGEVVKGCIYLIDHPEATTAKLMEKIKGPDFPLGGRIVTDRNELRTTYEEGRGSIKVRAEWKLDENVTKGDPVTRISIISIPHGVETGGLLTALGDVRDSRKLPQLLDVMDLSDEENGLNIVLEVKHGSDPDAVMTYLFKHTALEQNFNYNPTCLVPDEHGVLVPRRCSLIEILRYFLDFRLQTVRKRFEFQLAQLQRRIHILEGFAIVFNGLDKALKLIRESDGKPDAANKLMRAFPLDETQTMAILELQLYRISKLEIDDIREELADKQKRAAKIVSILKSEAKLWNVVKEELGETASTFGDKRRTTIGSSDEIADFDPQAYIVRENTNVVVTSDGWIRRVGKISSIDKLRLRDGDEVMAVVPTSTIEQVVFFSSDGTAFTLPVTEIPASTGYGEPLSKFARIGDGARIVAAIGTDPRFTPTDTEFSDAPPSPYLFIATAEGQVMRLPFAPFREASTKSGRKFCRLRKGDTVVHCELMNDEETVFLMSRQARLIHFSVSDVPILAAAGKGVRGLKLSEPGDVVLGAQRLSRPSDALRVLNENQKELSFGQMKYNVTGRGGKGVKTSQRTSITRLLRPEISLVDWSTLGDSDEPS
ncbi:MAG: DNA topoisomerase IV subunit A [Planctomycetaceae bacterium]